MSAQDPFEVDSGVSTNQRRLDQLAWLVEGSSMCTSVSIMNGRLYISANEFSTATREREGNQQVDYVCTVMEYFRDIAVGKISTKRLKKPRDALMSLICRNQINVATLGRISVSDAILEEVVCSETLSREQLPDSETVSRDRSSSHLAMGFGLDIFRRVRKLENSIKKAIKEDYSEITKEEFEAIQAFEHTDKRDSNILFTEPSKGVHAEMQILSRIVEAVDKEEIPPPNVIYVGISKRCCMNCHIMLNSANEILKEREVSIKFEGAHDADFSSNWIPPKLFLEGVKSKKKRTGKSGKKDSEDESSLAFEIGKRYAEDLESAEISSSGLLYEPPENSRFFKIDYFYSV